MKKNFFEYTANKNEILNKKSSIVNFSKKLFKYHENETPESDATKTDSFMQNLNEVLLYSKSRNSDPKKPDSKSLKIILYLVIVFFLISSCFFGPFFLLITSKIFVKVFWRQLMTTFLLFPIALCERKIETVNDFSMRKFLKLIIAALFHAIWMILFGFSLHFTSMTHVYILNNMDILFMNLSKLFTNKKISKLEVCGMLMLIISIILIGLDRTMGFLSESHIGDLTASEMFFKGDCLALLAAIAFVIYTFFIDNYELNSPFWFCGMFVSLFSSFFQMIICWMFGSSWDNEEINGIFGLFSGEWFFIHILYALISGIFFFMFMGIIKKKFEDSTYRFILNLTPICAALMTYWLDLEEIPGILIWICIILTIVAGMLIVSGKKDSEGLEFELNQDEMEEEGRNSNLYARGIEMRINENNKLI